MLYNPVKHSYVRDLNDYDYSSFQQVYHRLGRDALAVQFRRYPDYRHLALLEVEDNFEAA